MKLARALLVLCLLVPVAAFASSVDFVNVGGTLSGSSGAGLTLSGSSLIAISTPGPFPFTGLLGSVSFSTGSVAIGSLQQGGVLNAGGDFLIVSNGADTSFPAGTVFDGTFSGPVVWSLITLANGTHNYTLTGVLTGKWFTGQTVHGASVQLTINTGKGFFNGSTFLNSGDTDISGIGRGRGIVPEPATLTMLGTGFIFLARSFLRHQAD